jgi:hypothetical protein
MSIGWPQTFALDLDLACKALAVYAEEPNASIQAVSSRLGIGGPKVEGLNAWLKYLGLRDPKARKLTPIGLFFYRADPDLSDLGTLCVLHYLLVSNPDATVWYEAVNYFLADRSSFTRDDLKGYFESTNIGEHSPKQLRSDLGLFISTYTDSDRRAFQPLGFLKVRDEEWVAQPISDVPSLVLGFCLFHRLEQGLRESTTSMLRLLLEEGGPGRVFRLSEEVLRQKLAELESAGLLSVVRIADIDGVSYAFNGSPLDLLEQYFYSR